MNKKLILFGDSAFAEIAREYFESDTSYQVDAFVVEQEYLTKKELNGLPVVSFSDAERLFPPSSHDIFVAITYVQLNRLRSRITAQAKSMGYKLASYVSPRAFVWKNVEIGEHCFIFENNTIQPFVKIGDNVIIWSGNHLGHHSIVHDNCFISSQVVISGFCELGRNSFFGVNSTLANNIQVGNDNWIGPGITLSKSTEDNSLFSNIPPEPSRVSSTRFFKVKE